MKELYLTAKSLLQSIKQGRYVPLNHEYLERDIANGRVIVKTTNNTRGVHNHAGRMIAITIYEKAN